MPFAAGPGFPRRFANKGSAGDPPPHAETFPFASDGGKEGAFCDQTFF